ncbi:MAG: Fe-S cluster assembly protein SufD [Elusimicrobiota bacterium]
MSGTTAWLNEARERAWETFGRTAAPAKTTETWRRLPFENWRIDRLTENDALAVSGVEDGVRRAIEKAGGELLALEEAAQKYPDIVRPYLDAPTASADFRKFESANLALWRGGVFLRVPRGVRIEEPVHITFRHDQAKPFAFPRALIRVEEGAEVTVVEEHVSREGESAQAPVSAAFSQVTVGNGARLRFYSSQDLAMDAVHFSHQRIELGRDSKLEHYSVMLGARRHKSELQVVLGGAGAESEIRGVLLARGSQFFDPHTQQLHVAPRTRSNLLFRAAVRDKSRSIYTGLIRIEREAPDCEAYQTNRNLLISDEARADSTPVLEIMPDAVRCQHGSASGPVNQEELFYLASRGIPEQEAMRMLILGFFDPILSSFPLPELRDRLREKVEREAVR